VEFFEYVINSTRSERISAVLPFVFVLPMFTEDYLFYFYTLLFFGVLITTSRWIAYMISLCFFFVTVPIGLIINYLENNEREFYLILNNKFKSYVQIYDNFFNKYLFWLPEEGEYFE